MSQRWRMMGVARASAPRLGSLALSKAKKKMDPATLAQIAATHPLVRTVESGEEPTGPAAEAIRRQVESLLAIDMEDPELHEAMETLDEHASQIGSGPYASIAAELQKVANSMTDQVAEARRTFAIEMLLDVLADHLPAPLPLALGRALGVDARAREPLPDVRHVRVARGGVVREVAVDADAAAALELVAGGAQPHPEVQRPLVEHGDQAAVERRLGEREAGQVGLLVERALERRERARRGARRATPPRRRTTSSRAPPRTRRG